MSQVDNRRYLALIVVLAAFYFFALPYVIGLTAQLSVPPSAFSFQLLHLVAVVVCALPIAWLAIALFPERASRIALAIVVPASVVALMAFQRAPSTDFALTFALDFAKIFFVPWLLVRAYQWIAPSNQPLHPTPTAAEAPASGAGERRR